MSVCLPDSLYISVLKAHKAHGYEVRIQRKHGYEENEVYANKQT